MNVGIEALFTSALGLQAPWEVRDVRLDVSSNALISPCIAAKRCWPVLPMA